MRFLAESACQPLTPLRCTAVGPETTRAKTCDVAGPDAAGLAVEPGQVVNLVFQIGGAPHLRSYPVSSSWQPGRLSITVKKVAGGCVSNWLFDHLKPGDTVGALNAAG